MEYFIGVDIGGTKIKAGIITPNGKVCKAIEEKTNRNHLVRQMLVLIEQLLNEQENIKGIGVATAGRVDFASGVIQYATDHLPNWTGVKVKDLIESRFHMLACVDNDANCAAYGEMKMGSGRSFSSFICITLGTGVGSGIVINGELYRGKHGGAGEVGHMTLIPNGRPCNCGRSGCFEQYVSGSALIKDIEDDEQLKEMKVTPVEVFRLAQENHDSAKKIVNRFIDHLTIGLKSLQNILDVDGLILGGGVINSSQYWWDPFVEKMNKNSISPIQIKRAELKNDAGMIGAALMVQDYLS